MMTHTLESKLLTLSIKVSNGATISMLIFEQSTMLRRVFHQVYESNSFVLETSNPSFEGLEAFRFKISARPQLSLRTIWLRGYDTYFDDKVVHFTCGDRETAESIFSVYVRNLTTLEQLIHEYYKNFERLLRVDLKLESININDSIEDVFANKARCL
jgi:hypothetical protein